MKQCVQRTLNFPMLAGNFGSNLTVRHSNQMSKLSVRQWMIDYSLTCGQKQEKGETS